MPKCLILLSLIFSGLHLSAQTFVVSGRVIDTDSLPVAGATVTLVPIANDGTIDQSKLSGVISNENGRFWIKEVVPANYKISIYRVGYDTTHQTIEIIDRSRYLSKIMIYEAGYELETVTIESEQSMAQQMGDTTQFNASAFTTNPDASANDLIEKMPGIVMQNGEVQAQGEKVQQVLVDGKRFFGDDPTAALKNLPAEVVDKIQVFDQQSEQSQFTGFDDGQTTKTINIVTKVEMRNGTFGQGYAGYGYEDKYRGSGNLNLFKDDQRISILAQSNNINQQNFSADDLVGVLSSGNSRRGGRGGGRGGRGGGGGGGSRGGGGSANDFLVGQQSGISTSHALGLNYSDNWGKKIEVSGSYFFNMSDNVSEQDLRQLYLINADTGQVYLENSTTDSRNINHRLNFRFDYDLSERTSILIRPRLSLQQNNGTEFTDGLTQLGSKSLNSSDTDFESDLSGADFSNLILVRHRFAKRGRTLSVRFQNGYEKNAGDNVLYANVTDFEPPFANDSVDQVSSLSENTWTFSGNVMYTEPISKVGMLQFNYSYSPQWSDSEKETFIYEEASGGYNTLDTSLTNVFSNTFMAHNVGTGIMIRSRKLFGMLRVSGQWSELMNDQVFPVAGTLEKPYFNILPFAMIRYRVSQQKQMRLMYRASTSPPSVTQLQEVLDNSNPLQLSIGNSDLDQNYQHLVSLRYNTTNTSKGTVFFFYISGTFTQNYVGQSTLFAEQDTLVGKSIFLARGTQLTQSVNLDGYRRFRTFVSYGFPVAPLKSNLNLDLTADLNNTPSLINGESNDVENRSLGVGLTLSSNFSENVDFTISSRTSLSDAKNSLVPNLNTEYISQESKLKLNLIFWKGMVFRSQVTHQNYSGLSDGFNQDYWLWNMSLAKKLFKNKLGEIELSVFDLLRQNNNIQRNIEATYIEDIESLVLQRYVMLGFTYRIREFKSGGNALPQRDDRGRPGPGGPRDRF